MTRLEYYFRHLIALIICLTLGLSVLIVSTIIRDIPKVETKSVASLIQAEPGTVATTSTSTIPATIPTPLPTAAAEPLLSYITVTSSCDYNFNGDCVRIRSGPGLKAPAVTKLRNGVTLRADTSAGIEKDGHLWYKILFNETLRYPERVDSDWYIASEFTTPFTTRGQEWISTTTPQTNKRIIVDRGEQSLKAYDGEELFMDSKISTGLELTPTPRGEFTIYMKTPTRYMQGPLPGISRKYYDLPGVPWNLYFTKQGAVIHGAYWHQSFGKPYSNGCVNMNLVEAEKLYYWADVGTTVIVRD
jgi:lipoprotein-anchoring transpeptidase ErfK/SrfK